MKIKTDNRLWRILLIAGSIIFLVCAVWLTLVELHRSNPDIYVPFLSLMGDEADDGEDLAGKSYAVETCYTGDPYLADVLFQYSFQRTEDYIKNAEWIKTLGTENAQILIEKAEDSVDALFNRSYQERDIADETLSDLLADGITVYFADGSVSEGAADTVEKINGWFADTKTSMEAKFTTDKCMIFYDEGKVIVRGEFVFAVYNSDDLDTLKTNFGMDDLENGDRRSCVMELEFISSLNREDYTTYKLCGAKIL